MRHRVKKTSRIGHKKPDHTALMLRNLATSLVTHEKITTTKAKASALQSFVERVIAHATSKKEPREAIRYLKSTLTTEEAQKKVFTVLAPRFAARKGGLTRITPLGVRPGDGAMKVLVELV